MTNLEFSLEETNALGAYQVSNDTVFTRSDGKEYEEDLSAGKTTFGGEWTWDRSLLWMALSRHCIYIPRSSYLGGLFV